MTMLGSLGLALVAILSLVLATTEHTEVIHAVAFLLFRYKLAILA